MIAFDASGRQLFSRDVDDNESWRDQVFPFIGEPAQPNYAVLPVYSIAQANDLPNRHGLVFADSQLRLGRQRAGPTELDSHPWTGSCSRERSRFLLEMGDGAVELVANQSRA